MTQSAYFREAETYANDIIPKARGDAARMLEDARAYRDRVVADADGESMRFLALLTEYQKAPRVTRDRLYIDAVEEVYSNANKVILDSQGSGNLLYLPIDKLIEGATQVVTARRQRTGHEQKDNDPNSGMKVMSQWMVVSGGHANERWTALEYL